MTKTNKISPKKILLGVLIAIVAVVLVLVIAVAIVFHSELKTISSLERLGDKNLYVMTYDGDYGFDGFLEQGGASSDSDVVSYVVSRILKGIPLDFDIPDLGCSTILVESEDGGYLFGRNFDMYDSPAMVLYTEPDDGYRSIFLVNLAYIGYSADSLPSGLISSITTLAGPYAPIDGMNEMGLCVSVMQLDTDCTEQDNGLDDITTTTAIRLLLDKAATVDEAVELLSQYDMHSSANSCYHFEIADANGDVVVIEYVDGELVTVDSNYCTNFMLTEGDWDFGGGYERYNTLAETYEEAGGIMSAEELTELMSEVAQTENSKTQWTCIYDITNLTVTVYYQTDYENAYVFSFEDF
ncbi:MAG: linear amide C-N hydrolase [Oscillospiraceae bacterium]|nr:linear amide C-N hydrolase [Oscillospiraceae bacterium]